MEQEKIIQELTKLELSPLLKDKEFADKCIALLYEEFSPVIPKVIIRILYYGLLLPLAKKGDKLTQSITDQAVSSALKFMIQKLSLGQLLNEIQSKLQVISHQSQQEISQLEFNHDDEINDLKVFLQQIREEGTQNFRSIFDFLQKIYEQNNASDFLYVPTKASGKISMSESAALQFQSSPVELLGRNQEITQLVKFLHDDKIFSWMAITGQAGGGKSRIALELIKKNALGWYKGFYTNAGGQVQTNNWLPMAPTVVIFDDARNDIDDIRAFLSRCAKLCSDGKLYFKVKVILLERNLPDNSSEINQDPFWSKIIAPEFKELILSARESSLKLLPLGMEEAKEVLQKTATTNGNSRSSEAMMAPQRILEALEQNEELRMPLFLLLAGQAIVQGKDIDWNISNLIEHASMTKIFVGGSPENIYISALITRGTIWGPTPKKIPLKNFICANTIQANAQAYTITGNENFSFKPDILGEFFSFKFLLFLKSYDSTTYQEILKELFIHGRYGQREYWSMTMHIKSFFDRLGNDIANNLPDEWDAYFDLVKDIYNLVDGEIPLFYQRSLLIRSLDSIVIGGSFSQQKWFVSEFSKLVSSRGIDEIWFALAKYAIEKENPDATIAIIERKEECDLNQAYLDRLILEAAQSDYVNIIDLLINSGADINATSETGAIPLILAAASGKLKTLQFILQRGGKVIDIDARGPEGRTALHAAAIEGHVDVIELLLTNGADINAESETGATPLVLAAENGKLETLQFILQHKDKIANIEAKGVGGGTALHVAAREGHVDIIELLFTNGADINAESETGATPLVLAAENGKIEALQFILQHKDKIVNIEARGAGGGTALHVAAIKGHADVIELLLTNGADINAESETGATPLVLAAENGKIEALQFILQHKDKIVNIEARGAGGGTALHVAAIKGHADVIELLLTNGADINAESETGATPLVLAAENGKIEALQFILQHKDKTVDIEAKGAGGGTALHAAAIGGHVDVIELLLTNGADINAESETGATPLVLAAENGQLEALRFILQHKDKTVNIEAKGAGGGTALHVAARKGHLNIIELLLTNGADINAVSETGATPLVLSAQSGKLEALLFVLQHKDKITDIDAKGAGGGTALHVAAQEGYSEIIESLLVSGADINASANDGETPLITAAAHGKLEALRIILQHKDKAVNIEAKRARGITALHAAAVKDHVDIIELLLTNGADINAECDTGATPLVLAAENGKLEALKFILQHKDKIVNVEAKGAGGGTALHVAAYGGHSEIIELLLANGVDVNATDDDSDTPLSLAVIKRQHKAIKLLLQEGANKYLQNNDGADAWILAKEREDETAIALLETESVDSIDLESGQEEDEANSQQNLMLQALNEVHQQTEAIATKVGLDHKKIMATYFEALQA